MTSCGLSSMDWEAHRGAEDYTKLVSDEVLNVASQQ